MSSLTLGSTWFSRWRAKREPGSEPRRSLLDRLELWLWQARQREIERRLAGCVDVADVERVLRQLESFRPPHGFI